jgi:hypothetical protein
MAGARRAPFETGNPNPDPLSNDRLDLSDVEQIPNRKSLRNPFWNAAWALYPLVVTREPQIGVEAEA